jgi:hypothetical protein
MTPVTAQQKINEQFMDKLDQLQEKLNEVSIKIASLPEDMAIKFDKRYASKRTEVAVDRLGWLVITAVVGAVLILVIK